MKYDLVAFDLDGTLVDTIGGIAEAFNTVLSRHGVRTVERGVYRDKVGWGLSRTLDLVLPDSFGEGGRDLLLGEVQAEYRKFPFRSSSVYDGIGMLIDELISRDVTLLIYTNKDQDIADALIREFFGDHVFQRVLGKKTGYPAKPSPWMLREYLDAENLGDLSILFIGDTVVDLQTAENAECDFAGAGWGFRGERILKNAGARQVFTSPRDLGSWLIPDKKGWQ